MTKKRISKRKQWRVMLSNTADKCKHTKFSCSDCGTYIFQTPVWTEERRKQALRAAKVVQEMFKETEILNE